MGRWAGPGEGRAVRTEWGRGEEARSGLRVGQGAGPEEVYLGKVARTVLSSRDGGRAYQLS